MCHNVVVFSGCEKKMTLLTKLWYGMKIALLFLSVYSRFIEFKGQKRTDMKPQINA